ncbi:hypothetical protein [Curvivirga aplysinae]|uniref:hypothetical protein n=1 Tax=Curvivirga aplysinae TaxID=2529852 RepID=UPI0012BD0AF8|nr:hypothetical protein [Curvivirga aplysinae]MTI08985.1 hypothetical protein [Curvivirga aplysinae]
MRKSVPVMGLLMLIGLMIKPAYAEIQANFTPPATATSNLRIDLPDDMDFLVLTKLGVELDGIDITSVLSLDGMDFVYTPLEPLSNGPHELRLVKLEDDGSYIEEASWSFDITGGAQVASTDTTSEADALENYLRTDNLVELSYRAFQHLDESSSPKRTIVSGGGDLATGIRSGKWDANFRGNYLLQSDKNFAQTENVFDLGEYNLDVNYSGDTANTSLKLGHHDTGLSSHLISDFYQRGLSVKVGSTNSRIEAQGFAFNPDALAGADNVTGLNDKSERVQGLSASIKPFSSDYNAFKITTMLYEGKGGEDGIGTSGEDIVTEGAGWGAVAEKSFETLSANLRFEYNETKFDQDGDLAAEEQDGDAWSIGYDARLFEDGPIWLGDTADITWGFDHEEISTYFESLANQGAASDRKATNLFSNLYWGAVSSNLRASYETNNVDGLHNMPTDELVTVEAGLSYGFEEQKDDLAWLGTPYVTMTAFVADMSRKETPDNYTGADTNNNTESISFGGGSNYDEWYWSSDYSYQQFEDYTNTSSDTVNHLLAWNAGWSVSSSWEVTGGVEVSNFRNETTNNNFYDTAFRFGSQSELIQDQLDLNLDYNLNLASGSDDRPDEYYISGELEWNLIQSQANRPEVSFVTKGSMEDKIGKSSSTTTDEKVYQVFLQLRIKQSYSDD